MESSPKGDRQRLDALLVERGLAESRGRAQGLILSGSVRVGDRVVTKAGSRIAPGESLSVDREDRFLSRAGEKLDAAGNEEQRGCCLSMSATASSTGPCVTTCALPSWSGPTCAG